MIDISPEDKATLELGQLFQQHQDHPAVKAMIQWADSQLDYVLRTERPSLEWNMGYAAALRDLTKVPSRYIHSMDTVLNAQMEAANERKASERVRVTPQDL
jgi:hypothetical protein